jgi:glutathione S-transferase
MRVSVAPDVDGGEQPVEGELISATFDTVSILRTDPDVGKIGVHFPRFGYRVTRLD